MRILVADDSLTVRNSLKQILESHGYDVVIARDGREAWQSLRDESIPLAILDWEMPALSGPEVCRKLRKERPTHLMYIILLTGKDGLEYLTEALEAGASDYVVKPCHEAALLARLGVGQRLVNLQTTLVQKQKLESIGQLAAGVAHEINTPIQYIGDNLRFLRDAFDSLGRVIRHNKSLISAANPPEARADASTVERARSDPDDNQSADLDYMLAEVPQAIDQSLEGIERVAQIVRAMKEFAHPDTDQFVLIDVNRAVQTTVTVTRNEWKYVADLETDLDPQLPMVSCLPGQINQVILNLIVNAADAIREAIGDAANTKRTIRVTTKSAGQWVEIRIWDNGAGMPPQVQPRVFNPFFTTKQAGKGTGQGLAIAHNVVVNRHYGTIGFESQVGKGTCFTVRLPVNHDAALADAHSMETTRPSAA